MTQVVGAVVIGLALTLPGIASANVRTWDEIKKFADQVDTEDSVPPWIRHHRQQLAAAAAVKKPAALAHVVAKTIKKAVPEKKAVAHVPEAQEHVLVSRTTKNAQLKQTKKVADPVVVHTVEQAQQFSAGLSDALRKHGQQGASELVGQLASVLGSNTTGHQEFLLKSHKKSDEKDMRLAKPAEEYTPAQTDGYTVVVAPMIPLSPEQVWTKAEVNDVMVPESERVAQPVSMTAKMPYGGLEPYGREDTAQELTEESVLQTDKMVDQVERAEVAEEKRAAYRALTRLRGTAVASFDGVARSQSGNIDEYGKTHKWREAHPVHHLSDEEFDDTGAMR